MKRPWISITLSVALAGFAAPGSADAQSNFTPPNLNTNYGYQPYNDRNPTGFMHPNNMGYGRYVYSPKHTSHRSGSLSYRRFRGY
jgi:hypothetical protein